MVWYKVDCDVLAIFVNCGGSISIITLKSNVKRCLKGSKDATGDAESIMLQATGSANISNAIAITITVKNIFFVPHCFMLLCEKTNKQKMFSFHLRGHLM